jgi:hypothetical protein
MTVIIPYSTLLGVTRSLITPATAKEGKALAEVLMEFKMKAADHPELGVLGNFSVRSELMRELLSIPSPQGFC